MLLAAFQNLDPDTVRFAYMGSALALALAVLGVVIMDGRR